MGIQSGTLANRKVDSNLRNPSCSILSHTHLARGQQTLFRTSDRNEFDTCPVHDPIFGVKLNQDMGGAGGGGGNLSAQLEIPKRYGPGSRKLRPTVSVGWGRKMGSGDFSTGDVLVPRSSRRQRGTPQNLKKTTPTYSNPSNGVCPSARKDAEHMLICCAWLPCLAHIAQTNMPIASCSFLRFPFQGKGRRPPWFICLAAEN